MKQVILIRTDIDMSTGKTVAQGAHVSVLATQIAADPTVDTWLDNGGKKITLRVDSKQQLEQLIEDAEHMPAATIKDLGYTELDAGTLTAGAIGPANENKIDEITGHLPLYK